MENYLANPFVYFEQAKQYPKTNTDGIHRFVGHTPTTNRRVECILYYQDGELRGILNYYPQNIPALERKGNVNLFVHPHHRRSGIGSLLLDVGRKTFHIKLNKQKYTKDGIKFINGYSDKKRRGIRNEKLLLTTKN